MAKKVLLKACSKDLPVMWNLYSADKQKQAMTPWMQFSHNYVSRVWEEVGMIAILW